MSHSLLKWPTFYRKNTDHTTLLGNLPDNVINKNNKMLEIVKNTTKYHVHFKIYSNAHGNKWPSLKYGGNIKK